MVVLRCSQSDWNRVFPRRELARAVRAGDERFTTYAARRVIAALTERPDSVFEVAIGGSLNSNGPGVGAWLMPGGDGFAFSHARDSTGFRVSLCLVRGETPLGVRVRLLLHEQDLVLVQLPLEREPYICVMKTVAPRLDESVPAKLSEEFTKDRAVFGQSIQKLINNPIKLRPSEPSRQIQEFLGR